jgi:hypothetical protein
MEREATKVEGAYLYTTYRVRRPGGFCEVGWVAILDQEAASFHVILFESPSNACSDASWNPYYLAIINRSVSLSSI